MADDLDALIDSTPAAKPQDIDALIDSTPAAPGKAAPQTTAGSAFGHHALNAGTFGLSDEAGGLGTAVMQGITNWLPQSARDKLDLVQASPMDAYRDSRDRERALLELQAKEHRTASTLGDLAGTVAGAYVAPGQGLSGLAKTGAVMGFGNSDADLTHPTLANVGRAAADTGLGAGASMLIGKVGEKVADMAGGAAKRLAFKAAGPMLKDFRNVGAQGAEDIGQKLLDSGAVKFGSSAENIADRLAPMRDAAGKAIGAGKDALDQAGGAWNPNVVADRVEKEIVAPLSKSPADKALAAHMQGIADDIRAVGEGQPQPLSTLAGIRERFDKYIYAAGRAGDTPKAGALENLRGLLDNEFDSVAAKTSPDIAQGYNNAQREYSLLKPAENMAEDMASRHAANRFLSLGDRVGGGMIGAAIGASDGDRDPLSIAGSTIAGAMAGRLARTRGPATAAVTTRALANILGRVGSPMAARLAAGAAPGIGDRLFGKPEQPSPQSDDQQIQPTPAPPVLQAMGKVGEAIHKNPTSMGRYGMALANIQQKHGPAAAAAAHFVMAQTPGGYQDLTKKVNDGEEPEQP